MEKRLTACIYFHFDGCCTELKRVQKKRQRLERQKTIKIKVLKGNKMLSKIKQNHFHHSMTEKERNKKKIDSSTALQTYKIVVKSIAYHSIAF